MLDLDRNTGRQSLYLGGVENERMEQRGWSSQEQEAFKHELKREVRSTVIQLSERLFARLEETLGAFHVQPAIQLSPLRASPAPLQQPQSAERLAQSQQPAELPVANNLAPRSEERRVGKECRN